MTEEQNTEQTEPSEPDTLARLDAQDAKIDKVVDSLDQQGKSFMKSLDNLSEKVDSIATAVVAQAAAPQVQTELAPAPPEVTRLVDENTVRFFSPIKDYHIVREQGHQMIVDGTFKSIAQKGVQFANGIKDVDISTEEGQAVAEFLRTNPACGVDYWEDPSAKPAPGPNVTEGPRSTGMARGAKPAELAARA